MTPRIRNLASGRLLPLIVLLVISGCGLTDKQLRADIRQWIKAPPPHSPADYTKKSEELNA